MQPSRADWQVYDEGVRLASLVEPLGFDSIWTVEHHFTPYTMVPNSLQFLTFMAGRTERVDFGTMVVVLPWHDPIRVAEEVAMLDVLAGGRQAHAGLRARAPGGWSSTASGSPMGESRDRFLESLEIVRAALSNQEFSFDGRVPPDPVDVDPAPAPLAPTSPTACTAPGAAPRPSRSPPTPASAPLFIPQKSWEEIGEEVVAVQRHPGRAGLGAAAARSSCAGCTARPTPTRHGRRPGSYMTNYNDSALRHYEFHDADHFTEAGGYDFYAKMAEARKRVGEEKVVEVFARHQVWGTPEQCIEKLRRIRATTDAAEFVGVFTYGDLPVEQAEASMRLFAAEVLPVLHADESRSRPPTDRADDGWGIGSAVEAEAHDLTRRGRSAPGPDRRPAGSARAPGPGAGRARAIRPARGSAMRPCRGPRRTATRPPSRSGRYRRRPRAGRCW